MSEKMRSFRLHTGRTRPRELLVGLALGVIIGMVVILFSMRTYPPKGVKREAMSNIFAIAVLLDKFYGDGNLAYNDGDGDCPGKRTYCNTSCADQCDGGPGLDPNKQGVDSLVVQGGRYRYTVEVTDNDGDGKCERYLITATGCTPNPPRGCGSRPRAVGTLSVSSDGARTGSWR